MFSSGSSFLRIFFQRNCFGNLSFFIPILTIYLALIAGCSIIEPDGGDSKNSDHFSITSEGTSSTEAWLKIKARVTTPLKVIHIKRDGSLTTSFRLYGQDTLIYDDSLLPCRSYSYSASLSSERFSFSSEEVAIRTMDTTSHDFHFRMFIVCNRSSSLRDVAIINENDIWAVGDMYMNRPEGNDDYEPVGAVHWDGREWKQVKVPFKDAWWSSVYPGFLSSVIAFGADNVYFASYSGLIKWDGKKFVQKALFMQDTTFPGPVFDIWGSDEKNIYAVGYKGSIYHYTGDNSWHKIQSGTDLTIQSVWGSTDPLTGEEVVLCVASNPYTDDGRRLLRIKNDKVYELPVEGLNYSLYSVWFRDMKKVYVTGSAGFLRNLESEGSDTWHKFSKGVTEYWSLAVRGNALNDIFLVGAYGNISHFNGRTWKNYLGKETEMFYGDFYGMDVKGNTMCAVGATSREPIVVLGQRN